ncbi:MAG: phosphohistidine phosphatase [Planctomycetota bacterium]|jgi:phosphohistidine phosphatase
MKKLYIIRHAKSDWKHSDLLKDIDRPLSARGIRNAYEMAERLKVKNSQPDYVLASAGIRALHTSVIFSHQLGFDDSLIHVKKDLYHAAPNEILRQIRQVDNAIENLFLFAHNPGISEFVGEVRLFIENMPTCAVIEFSTETNWDDLSFKDLKLVDIDSPKMIKK